MIPPGYKQTEVGVIPEEWEVADLGEVTTQIGDGLHGTPVYSPLGSYFFINGNNLSNGRIVITNETQCVDRSEFKIHKKPLGDSSILMSINGTIGNLALFNDEPVMLGKSVAFLNVSPRVSKSFIYHSLQASNVTQQFFGGLTGSTIGNLGLATIRCTKIPLPQTEAEQRAIATALSDVDALLAALDRLIAKQRDLKQAAMQQLLTGQTRLPGFMGTWETKRLGDCLLSRPDYGINAAAVPYSDRLPSYIRITDISEHGRYCPDPQVSVNSVNSDQYYLREGDVVFARTGASVGKSYLYEPHDGELVFAGFLIRVRPNPDLLVSAFLAAYTTTKPYWSWVRLMSMRSGQPGINGNEYAQLPLLLPPLPEQTTIATILSDMDLELAALEQRRDKTRALKQGMMQELLTGRTRLV